MTVLCVTVWTYLALTVLLSGEQDDSSASPLPYLLGNLNVVFKQRDAALMNLVFALSGCIALVIFLLNARSAFRPDQYPAEYLPWNVSYRYLKGGNLLLPYDLRLKIFTLHALSLISLVAVVLCINTYVTITILTLYPWTMESPWLCVTNSLWLAFYTLLVIPCWAAAVFITYTGLMTHLILHTHNLSVVTRKLDCLSRLSANLVIEEDVTSVVTQWMDICGANKQWSPERRHHYHVTINAFIAAYIPYAVTCLLVLYCVSFLELTWGMRLILYPALVWPFVIFFGLLLFASHPAWTGRRPTTGQTLFSIAARLSSQQGNQATHIWTTTTTTTSGESYSPPAHILINRLVKSDLNTAPFYLMTLPLNYLNVGVLTFEGATYFLLLVTVLRP